VIQSNPPRRVCVCFGTRPEVIKLAPVIAALQGRELPVELLLCSTGQHRELLTGALDAFDLSPDLHLDVMRPGQHLSDLLGRLMLALRPVIEEFRPDVVVAQGDTTTVMAAALAANYARTAFAHVEAGLRTGDKARPFPEEINRRVAGSIADYHFAPTPASSKALLSEGIDPARVYLTGNTVVDALRTMQQRVAGRALPAGVGSDGRRLVLVTAHRRENFGQPFRQLCLALGRIARQFDDIEMVFPVHMNPNVREPVGRLLGDVPNIRLIDPVGYADCVALMDRAELIITDSGGIQEEAPALGKPVLVMRDKTERPEAVAAGVVELVGTDHDRIVSAATSLLSDADAYAARARVVDVYGDGRASERIADVLLTGRMSDAFQPAAAATCT
jgi:UDP-N-acetylglucosamine 2-epimerase (non-hydrolysing)